VNAAIERTISAIESRLSALRPAPAVEGPPPYFGKLTGDELQRLRDLCESLIREQREPTTAERAESLSICAAAIARLARGEQ
jgi:hypothetical protein